MATLSPLLNTLVGHLPSHTPRVWRSWAVYNNGSTLHSIAFHRRQQFSVEEFSSAFSRKWSKTSSSITRGVKVLGAKGKGFGELVKKNKQETSGGEVSVAKVCPCGGGEDLRDYASCCARFHGGVVEPDALTLMKARFSAYALGVVPYVVRTTHPNNPDFEDEEKLEEDVRATCEGLRFIKLDILDHEELSESEAFVSFVAHYALVKGGRGGERKQLKEKSHFVNMDGRWLFRETVSLSQASEAAWIVATTPNVVQPKVSRKPYAKSKAAPTKVSPRGF